MHCASCVLLIEETFKELPNISYVKASLADRRVKITGDFTGSPESIAEDLTKLVKSHGYVISTEKIEQNVRLGDFVYAIPIAAMLIAGFIALQKLGLADFINASNVSYGTAFIVGLIASVSTCLAVVGGLVMSLSASSAKEGGDLGWFDPRGMIPEFGAAVAKLAKGKFTQEPVKTQFGYHVILLEDSRPLPVPPLEQVKAALTQQLQQQNLKKLFDEMKAKAKIEIAQAPIGFIGTRVQSWRVSASSRISTRNCAARASRRRPRSPSPRSARPFASGPDVRSTNGTANAPMNPTARNES